MNESSFTISQLIDDGIIPDSGGFDITEAILLKYMETYSSLAKGDGVYSKDLARKLAGLDLLKLKFSRGETYLSCKEGLVYVITNPAWKGLYKVGMTIDLVSRLNSYQTYSPYRDYKVSHYMFALDRKKAEKILLSQGIRNITEGEWVVLKNIEKLVKLLEG